MRRNRRVKILATLGPASSSEEMIRKLHEAGADAFRINMSHADHDLMRELVRRIRKVETDVGLPIGILADLQGPKLRVAQFIGGKAELTTVQGGKLVGTMMGNTVMLTDAKGGMSHVTKADLDQSNGVIHVVDAVLMP